MTANQLVIDKAEIDAANAAINDFVHRLEEDCPNMTLVGFLIAVKNVDGNAGCLAVPSPRLNEAQFAEILREMGTWMTNKMVQ